LESRLYKTILSVFYGCETWSVTWREEYELFENKAFKKIFVPEKDEENEHVRT
jgi:hypothetical protein